MSRIRKLIAKDCNRDLFQRFADISNGDFGTGKNQVNINITINNHYNGEIDNLTINE